MMSCDPCEKGVVQNLFQLYHGNLFIFKASCISFSPNTPH